MGQVADDMLNGMVCSDCGCYFQGEKKDTLYEHGYPVVCQECWSEYSDKERRKAVEKGLQRALVKAF